MPRVLQFKHHSRFHPNSSANGATRARRPFRYRVHQKKTNLQRLLVALHTIRPTGPTFVQDILDKISDQAAENDEALGRRWNQFVHIALSILRKNGYLQVQDDDDDEYCWLTEDGVRIMTDADNYSDLWNQLPSCEKHRRAGQYIQWIISPTRMRSLTRRELDIENRKLEQQREEHMRVCPIVDTASVAGPSTTHTPTRNSASLHNPGAYPTPPSLPRASSILRPASMSPPPTPLSRNYSSSIGIQQGDHSSDDNDRADTDSVPVAVSNEGQPVSTCHNTWLQGALFLLLASPFVHEVRHDIQASHHWLAL